MSVPGASKQGGKLATASREQSWDEKCLDLSQIATITVSTLSRLAVCYPHHRKSGPTESKSVARCRLLSKAIGFNKLDERPKEGL